MSSLEELFPKKYPRPISSRIQQTSEPVAEERKPDVDVTNSVFYSATRWPSLPEFLHTNYLQLPQFRFVWEKAAAGTFCGNLVTPGANAEYRAGNILQVGQEQRCKTAQQTTGLEGDATTWKQFLPGCSKSQPFSAAENAPAIFSSHINGGDEKLGDEHRQRKPRVRKVVKGGSIVTITSPARKQSARGEKATVKTDENTLVDGKNALETPQKEESSVHRPDSGVSDSNITTVDGETWDIKSTDNEVRSLQTTDAVGTSAKPSRSLASKSDGLFSGLESSAGNEVTCRSPQTTVIFLAAATNLTSDDDGWLSGLESIDNEAIKSPQTTVVVTATESGKPLDPKCDDLIIDLESTVSSETTGTVTVKIKPDGLLDSTCSINVESTGKEKRSLQTTGALADTKLASSLDSTNDGLISGELTGNEEISLRTTAAQLVDTKLASSLDSTNDVLVSVELTDNEERALQTTNAPADTKSAKPLESTSEGLSDGESTGNKDSSLQTTDVLTDPKSAKPQDSESDGSYSEAESLAELVMADYDSDSDDYLEIGNPKLADKGEGTSDSDEGTSDSHEKASDSHEGMHDSREETLSELKVFKSRGMATRTRSAAAQVIAKQKRAEAKAKRKARKSARKVYKLIKKSERAMMKAKKVKQGPRKQTKPFSTQVQNARTRQSAPSENLHKDRYRFDQHHYSRITKTGPLESPPAGAQEHLYRQQPRSFVHAQEMPPAQDFRGSVCGSGGKHRTSGRVRDCAGQATTRSAVLDNTRMQNTLLSSVAGCAVDITIAASEKEPVKKRLRGGVNSRKKHKNRTSSTMMTDRRRPPRIVLESKAPICVFYQQGHCQKGENCTFRHEGPVVGPQPVKKRCKFYALSTCEKGNCPFMHSSFPCLYFHMSRCRNGNSCKFSHEPLTSETKRLLEEDSPDYKAQNCGDTHAPGAAGTTLSSHTVTPNPRDKHVDQNQSSSDSQTSAYNLRVTSTRKRHASDEQPVNDNQRGKYQNDSKRIAVEDSETPGVFFPGMYRDTSQ